MIINELELFGFKSFATKTKINFSQKTTAIVGPNGSGKSNILDALKWVLGERSIKSMRGEKMEDIIFSGTDTQKSANYAQVSLHINNEDNELNINSTNVVITRRLYKDGQSQYLINDKQVSLKDIQDCLMNTGLGKSCYSFMEQGRIDTILSIKPEERRIIFEEAAGISRFKQQQEDAEKNLMNTKHNIDRIKDVIHELERELKIKKEQADKTTIYNKLIINHKEIDLKLKYATLVDYENKITDLSEKVTSKNQIREKIKQRILRLEEQLNFSNKEKEDQLKKLYERKNKIHEKTSKIHQNKDFIEQSEKIKLGLIKEAKQIDDKIKNIENRIHNFKKNINEQEQSTIQVLEQINDCDKLKKQLTTEINELQKVISTLNKDIEICQQQQIKAKDSLKQLRTQQETALQNLLTQLKLEKQKWSQDNQNTNESKAKNLKSVLSIYQELINMIETSDYSLEEIKNILKKINFNKLENEINTLSNIEIIFKKILLEKESGYAKKEIIDTKIIDLEKNLEELYLKQLNLQEEIKKTKDLYIQKISLAEKNTSQLNSLQNNKNNIKQEVDKIKSLIKYEEQQLLYFQNSLSKNETEQLNIISNNKKYEIDISNLDENIKKEIIAIAQIENKIDSFDHKKLEFADEYRQENQKLEEKFQEINSIEVKLGSFIGHKDSILQEVYSIYNITEIELNEKFKNQKINFEKEKAYVQSLKEQINSLGNVNQLAIEEFASIQTLYNHHNNQLQDILNAQKHILDIIDTSKKKSEKIFLETFQQIESNFKITFQKLFNGGQTSLSLIEPEKILESGIDIQVQPPGKKAKSLRLLSGGEKSLTAIALMFAIYMVKSSPICVLDEIDAPLDDQNVLRFLTLLKEFQDKTQFILITHNKKTMVHADTLLGITMEEPGVSKILSMITKE